MLVFFKFQSHNKSPRQVYRRVLARAYVSQNQNKVYENKLETCLSACFASLPFSFFFIPYPYFRFLILLHDVIYQAVYRVIDSFFLVVLELLCSTLCLDGSHEDHCLYFVIISFENFFFHRRSTRIVDQLTLNVELNGWWWFFPAEEEDESLSQN